MGVWPNALIQEIAERRVVFFVGAGLSKFAYPTLPAWAGLLLDLAGHLGRSKDKVLVKQLVRRQAMLDAAQIISHGVPRADRGAFIRNIFQIRPVPHHNIYKNILDMDPKVIITTNYDEFIEKNFEHFSAGNSSHNVCKHNGINLINDLRSPIRSIVKMHGCVTEPNDVVLDRVSYFEARRQNQALFQAIAALMTVNTVVFIGYSISDPDIQLILENMNLYSRAAHPHYALMEKFDHSAIKGAISQTYNIDVIEYPKGAHGSVPTIMDSLAADVLNFRVLRGII